MNPFHQIAYHTDRPLLRLMVSKEHWPQHSFERQFTKQLANTLLFIRLFLESPTRFWDCVKANIHCWKHGYPQ